MFGPDNPVALYETACDPEKTVEFSTVTPLAPNHPFCPPSFPRSYPGVSVGEGSNPVEKIRVAEAGVATVRVRNAREHEPRVSRRKTIGRALKAR
jgi:hypothetical protein